MILYILIFGFVIIAIYLIYVKYIRYAAQLTVIQRNKIELDMKNYSDNLHEYLIRQREFMHVTEERHKKELLYFRNPLKLYPKYYGDKK